MGGDEEVGGEIGGCEVVADRLGTLHRRIVGFARFSNANLSSGSFALDVALGLYDTHCVCGVGGVYMLRERWSALRQESVGNRNKIPSRPWLVPKPSRTVAASFVL